MFGLGMPELIVILVIVLVIFGASRLPQLGEGLGKAIKGFKKGISDVSDASKDSEKKDGKA
jgi:sec-independent protein translocase protein TatA